MAIVPTIGGRQCLHPGEAFRAVMEQSTPVDFWQQANSYACPLGAEPGSAWLLMLRSDLDKLDGNASHQLKWVDGNRTLTIASLVIVKSSVMNLALAGDKKAACLVEFQDERRILKKFSSINAQYNVRIPAPSTTSGVGLYYTDSTDTAAAFTGQLGVTLSVLGESLALTFDESDARAVWTWQTMLDDIWENLPGTEVGSGPLLPYTPDGIPEGWRFIGENAWYSLHEVLAKINCTTSYNPILDTHSYIRLGTTQAGLAASLTALKNRLMYDYDPGQDYQLANMPATVRVFFQRRELYHGIERDTPDDSNWEMEPVVSKDVATSITGATVGSVLNWFDDLPAEFDDTGVNSNSAALQTRANEIGGNIRDRIDVSDERLRRMFSGLVTNILPGSEITEVIWRDYGDETGLVTEVIRKPREDADYYGYHGYHAGEKLQTPDLDRATHPLWPRLPQPVRVDDGSSDTSAKLDPNSDGLFPGFVRRWANGGWTSLDACWIRPVDLEGDDEDTVTKLKQLDTFMGRLSGVETSENSTRPVYICREGSGTSGKGLPIRAVIGGTLAPKQDETGFYYIDRDGVPDTDWALMDGISNSIARGGSGIAMWDPADDNDTFFVRARGSATDADDTAGGRTVPFADPNQDIIQLNDHNDHSHEILDLCEIQYQAGSGGDPNLCAWDPVNGNCGTECVSDVRTASSCGDTDVPGVLEHTFGNGQGTDPMVPDDFNVAPPNKAWHWFERIAETGATAIPPSAAIFQQVSQPMIPLPPQPVAAGAVYQDDGSP